MSARGDQEVKISRAPARASLVALPALAEDFAVLDPGRDAHPEESFFLRPARAPAPGASLFFFSPARRTGGLSRVAKADLPAQGRL